jgi:LAO/AO transport system kinase
VTGDGIAALWQQVIEHRRRLTASGELTARRRTQQIKWMWAMLEERLMAPLRDDPALASRLPEIEAAVADGTLSPVLAVNEIVGILRR